MDSNRAFGRRISNVAPGSTAYKTRRFAPALAGACGGLDPVSARRGPGSYRRPMDQRPSRKRQDDAEGGTVNAHKAARDARAERIQRTRRALTVPSTASG